jgi:signal transduction histidine kinase
MKRWLAPSLLRRVFFAAMVAATLVLVVILVLNFVVQSRGEIRENQAWMQKEGDFIEQLASDAEASQFLSREPEFYYRNFKKKALMSLLDKAGKPVYVTHQPFDCASLPLTKSASKIEIDGKQYHAYRHQGPRWSLCVAFPVPGFGEFVKASGRSIGRQLAIGVSLVVPALLLAIKSGLLPLARLSKRLEARDAEDLAPLHFDAKYRELKPLVASIDSLLLRLRNQIAREQAFVENAAHELRTPLAVIAAQKDVLAKAMNPPTRDEAKRHIGTAIERALHLIEQLSELARVDRAGQRPNLPVNLTQLTELAVAHMFDAAAARRVTLFCDTEPDLMHCLEQESYMSILNNLIDNAIRYGQMGGRVAIALKMVSGSVTSHLQLTVADDGPGIAAALRELVFERFYRGPGHEARGSGLGLSIVKQAVKRLGASIRLADGIDGKGCQFIVILPVSSIWPVSSEPQKLRPERRPE